MKCPVCSVCYENFDRSNALKIPKNLACGHCICLGCAKNIYSEEKIDIRCPSCRKPTTKAYRKKFVPEDLPTNFPLLDVVDNFLEQRNKVIPEVRTLKRRLMYSMKKRERTVEYLRRKVNDLERSTSDYDLKGEEFKRMKSRVENHHKSQILASKNNMKKDIQDLRKIFKLQAQHARAEKKECAEKIELGEFDLKSFDQFLFQSDSKILKDRKLIEKECDAVDKERDERPAPTIDDIEITFPEIDNSRVYFTVTM